MEYYSYVNIFEQKGVAYILLMSFLVLAVLLIRYLSGPPEKDPTTAEKSAKSGKGAADSRWAASHPRENS
jgi:hypothetical protein